MGRTKKQLCHLVPLACRAIELDYHHAIEIAGLTGLLREIMAIIFFEHLSDDRNRKVFW